MFVTRHQCPACGASEKRTLFHRRYDEPPVRGLLYTGLDPSVLAGCEYRAEHCLACDTIYQGEVGDADFLTVLYSEWLENTDDPEAAYPDYRFDVEHPWLSRDGHEIMTAAAHLGVPVGELVTLDFGMGWGSWARVAAALGCTSFGNDVADSRMNYVATRGVRPARLEELEGLDAHFINTEQVMEHLPDPAGALERLVKALRPGGILKISVPAPAGIAKVLKSGRLTPENVTPLAPLEHLNCFNRQSLRTLAARFGLRPAKPSFSSRYAFLTKRRTLDLRDVKRTAKELARPVYQYRSKTNLYEWFTK